MIYRFELFMVYGLLCSAFFMLSTGFSSNGFALLAIPFLLFFLLYKIFFVDLKINLKSLFFSIAIVFLLFSNFSLTYFYWREDFSQVGNFVLSLIGVLVYVALSDIFNKIDDKKICSIIDSFLIFNIATFFLQIISYYIFSYDLDFSEWMGGAGNRALNYSEIYRPTGIYDEPAIYGLFLSILIACKLFFTKKLDLLIFIGIISLILSFSFVSIILAIGLILILFLMRFGGFFFLICFFVFLTTIFIAYENSWIPDFLLNRLESLTNGNDGSTSNKIQSFQFWLNEENVRNFGFGFIGLREWTPEYFDAIYDMTLYGTAITQFGLFLAPLFICWMIAFLWINGWSCFSLCLCFLIFIKLSAVHILVFWVFLAFYQRSFLKNDLLRKKRSKTPVLNEV